MLRVNRLTDYATVILCHMAARPNDMHSALEIADKLAIARPTVSKILKYLMHEQLVISHRGATGGYRLALDPEQISVARVIRAMEGQVGMTECSIQSGLCEYESVCAVRGNWQKISQAILHALEGVSIADMTHSMQTPIFNFQAQLQSNVHNRPREGDQS